MQFKQIGSLVLWIMVSWTTARAQIVSLAADSVCGVAGATIVVPVQVNSFQNMIGAQGSIGFNPAVARFDSVADFGLPYLSGMSFGTNNATSGTVTFSWDDPTTNGVSLPNGAAMFSLYFTLMGQPGDSTSFDFLSSPTLLEFFDSNFNAFQPGTTNGWICVENPGVGTEVSISEYPGLEVFPSPATFNSRVRIRVGGEAGALKVYDLKGKMLNQMEFPAFAGETIEIEWGRLCPGSDHRELMLLSWEGTYSYAAVIVPTR